MNEAMRNAYNAERLNWLHTSIRGKVAVVVKDMEGHGLRPLLASSTFRSPAEQMQLYKAGRSQVKRGFHCATNRDGTAGSLAADIVDADLSWNASGKFWLMLGSSAMAHGLAWGGLWGLPQSLRDGLLNIITDKEWNRPVKLGWDVAHIETSAVTIAQAKAGNR